MAHMESEIIRVVRGTKYPLEAFLFVQGGLDYTVRHVHGERAPHVKPGERHVSGRVLCQGLRDYALEQYGLLARAVLGRWHIHSTQDFGRIVFAMVEAGLLHKTPEDSLHDFDGVYDFAQAFPAELSVDLGRLAARRQSRGRRSPSNPA